MARTRLARGLASSGSTYAKPPLRPLATCRLASFAAAAASAAAASAPAAAARSWDLACAKTPPSAIRSTTPLSSMLKVSSPP